MKIKLDTAKKDVYFSIKEYKFKGVLENRIFTLLNVLKVIPVNYSPVELDQFYITKIVDKRQMMITKERLLLGKKGIVYEN